MVLIADDRAKVRSGLRALVEERAGWEVVVEASNGAEAVAGAIESSRMFHYCPLTYDRLTRRLSSIP